MIETEPDAHPVVDPATIDRARAGDDDAIALLWRTYHPQVLRLLLAKRTPEPEDVASQVWIDVGRAFDRFVGDGTDFRRWIFTIASRRSIDAFRSAARLPTGAIDGPATSTAHPGADVDADRADAHGRAMELIRRLPPATAEAVMLRCVHDMSVAEVAAIMDREMGTVRVLVHRGLRRLRELLEADAEAGAEVPGGDVTNAGVTSLI